MCCQWFGQSSGKVGELAVFNVKVNDGAGPGPLAIQVSGPHPPQPITLSNKEDNVTEVTYNPVVATWRIPGTCNRHGVICAS